MQGKGDSNRTSDYTTYRQRFDLIDWNKAREPVYEDTSQKESDNRDCDTVALKSNGKSF